VKLFRKKKNESNEKGTFFQTTCPKCGNKVSGNLPSKSFYG
jgi:ribosomal protein S27E